MIKYNANPKGWKTDDCVIRAIALATDKTWDQVFTDLNVIAFKKKRTFNDPCGYTSIKTYLIFYHIFSPLSNISYFLL